MRLTPSEASEHIKESMIQYLETAYKIAHPAVFAERGEILRQRGVVAQAPFIEATPAFPPAHKLSELEKLYPQVVSPGLAALMQFGVPVDRFPLYTHQEEALLAALGDRPDLLVATGTGSGKTESFMLPILNDILHEAPSWAPVTDQALPGRFDVQKKQWLHSRRHEQRPAAMRGIVLYPMNALVNDQLSRLRRILARGASPDWQKQQWQGNVIHFGMYTGLSMPTGHWSKSGKPAYFAHYLQKITADWGKLREDLRDTGNWPRPDSPEMLCRWDMQVAPPDVLVTNYSMLEYMLVRPIEARIFDLTRQWLKNTPDARLTLVVDEAHTYTGALGTEVAYLIRRLKERLGLAPGSPQFRAIATTASVPSGADNHLLQFVADLFGEPESWFTLIHVGDAAQVVPDRQASSRALFAFERFHQTFSLSSPEPAIAQLTADLDLEPVEEQLPPQVALYTLLKHNHDIQWTRQRTARRATLLDQLADECWPGLQTSEERERATAGIISAGSFARSEALPDTPPLISVRMHLFFRGVYGIWACMDPMCPKAPPLPVDIASRPVGKLYMDPRPWCECGARVLELFSCRQCGLLYLGGIPDSAQGSLWPWSDDLSGERADFKQFEVFGVEAPDAYASVEYRSTRTTLPTHPSDSYARPIYPVQAEGEGDTSGNNLPRQCPRCRSYRQIQENGREIVEPLRTKGPRTFSVIAEDGFRVQPRATHGDPPNYGRKALLFTDSRQNAAQLAADIRNDHHNDVFRQLVYRALMVCIECYGSGSVEQTEEYTIGKEQAVKLIPCALCQGTGKHPHPQSLSFDEVRSHVIQFQLERGINPTNGIVEDYFKKMEQADPACYTWADRAFHMALRRELSEKREFALEPLGLACWRVKLPEQIGKIGTFPCLSEPETRLFLQAVTRILATENILLPPSPLDPWAWPDQVKEHERNVLIWGFRRESDQGRHAIPYNLNPTRKLGRYVLAVSEALVALKWLSTKEAADQWVKNLAKPLWDALRGFKIVSPAGKKFGEKTPYGIRIDMFDLFPIGSPVQRCSACAYIMSDALFNVCLRCGQQTKSVLASSLHSFYRRSALHALPGSLFDDPYPLRAVEHTAQIPGREARNEERWFQDLFHDDQNPDDHRVDVLSVTTTMEMGIDIGSLLSVGMRNVPPTVANYQQRAGRAGRRGSALATVLSFAQFRSHDQYYFAHPPEIVSFPPRVPVLYLLNEVIARRHVRSLLLQAFFYRLLQKRQATNPSNLFEAWGTVADFTNTQGATHLRTYLAWDRLPERCKQIIDPTFVPQLETWIHEILTEVQPVINRCENKDSILSSLIDAGLLPKYAFPIDVVDLFIPSYQSSSEDIEQFEGSGMQRDLRVAITEYAPGAEVMKGEFPNTYIYQSAGVYDRYNSQPDYCPTGMLVECMDCQSVTIARDSDDIADQCEECGSFQVTPLPYLRPRGFTVDCALPNNGRELYQRGGRERGGYTLPARLRVGQTSFQTGKPQLSFAPRLYVHVRQGELFTCNKGPNPTFPGFIICPDCGRALDPDKPGSHTYPANVPPLWGRNAGPRAGTRCPNTTDFRNQVVLGHKFFSEIILLGVDLPDTLDAPFQSPSGKAIWYSFGMLVANAAALVLQIDRKELEVGIRAVRRGAGHRLHGEVFLYDDVPGGAGYARAIEQNLEAILQKALKLGDNCPNPDCQGACYHCMFDYRNQPLHPLLNRKLGAAMLRFILHNQLPSLDPLQVEHGSIGLAEYARTSWTVLPGTTLDGQYFPLVLRDPEGGQVGLWVIHPLQARPTSDERQAFLSAHGVRCAVHTTFDLERRPFWVLNNLTW